MKANLKNTAEKFKELTGFEMNFEYDIENRYMTHVMVYMPGFGPFSICFKHLESLTEPEIFKAWNDFVKSLEGKTIMTNECELCHNPVKFMGEWCDECISKVW